MTQQPPPRRAGADNGRWRFTPDLQDELIRLVRAGNDRGEAAKRAKVAERTFKYWMQKGRVNLEEVAEANERESGSGDALLNDYGVFRLEIIAAEAAVEASLKEVVMRAALGDATKGIAGNWHAALEVLERRWPARWSKRFRASQARMLDDDEEPAGGGEGPADVIPGGLTNEAAFQIEEKFLGIPTRSTT